MQDEAGQRGGIVQAVGVVSVQVASYYLDVAPAAVKVADKDKLAYLMFRINIYNQPGTIWIDDLQLTEVE